MYIILVAILIVIAAYYPIKLIKFYSMESTEQALKAKITQDLREGKVSHNLILLVLGEGGLRLTRNQLDVIFEWMLNHWWCLRDLHSTRKSGTIMRTTNTLCAKCSTITEQGIFSRPVPPWKNLTGLRKT